ncbi:MAG: hypothetical protein ACK5PW_02755 [Burkholderiales bacterium]|jgi:hypothetical protein
MSATAPPLVVLYCLFRPERLSASRLELHRLLAGVPGPVSTWCVANCRPPSALADSFDRVIEHDNSNWEFGAWQRGLDQLMAEGLPFRGVLLVNDTFGVHDRADPSMVRRRPVQVVRTLARRRPAVSGRVDSAQRWLPMHGISSDRWIRSNVVCLNRAALSAISCRIEDRSACLRWIDPQAHGPLPLAADIDPELSAHLRAWLLPDAEPEGTKWYSAASIATADRAFVVNKILAILQELSLSRRLQAVGAQVLRFDPPPLTRVARRFAAAMRLPARQRA